MHLKRVQVLMFGFSEPQFLKSQCLKVVARSVGVSYPVVSIVFSWSEGHRNVKNIPGSIFACEGFFLAVGAITGVP